MGHKKKHRRNIPGRLIQIGPVIHLFKSLQMTTADDIHKLMRMGHMTLQVSRRHTQCDENGSHDTSGQQTTYTM